MLKKKSKYRKTKRKPQKLLKKLQKCRKTAKKPSKISEKRQKFRKTVQNFERRYKTAKNIKNDNNFK